MNEDVDLSIFLQKQHILITNFASNLESLCKVLNKDINNIDGTFAYITDGILHLLREYKKFVLEDKFKEGE